VLSVGIVTEGQSAYTFTILVFTDGINIDETIREKSNGIPVRMIDLRKDPTIM
jgi:hypothetical protein